MYPRGTKFFEVQNSEMGYCTPKWGTVGNPAAESSTYLYFQPCLLPSLWRCLSKEKEIDRFVIERQLILHSILSHPSDLQSHSDNIQILELTRGSRSSLRTTFCGCCYAYRKLFDSTISQDKILISFSLRVVMGIVLVVVDSRRDKNFYDTLLCMQIL
jgi:hypothetical protein